MQIPLAEILPDGSGQRIRGQRACGDDHRALGYLRHFLGYHRNIGMVLNSLCDQGGEAVPVNRQTAACLYSGLIGAGNDQASHAPQFFLQKAYRVFQPVASQGVGAYQLAKVLAVMGRGHLVGLHLEQLHLHLGKLPRGFTARQAGTDHFYLGHSFAPSFFRVVFFAAGFLAAFFPAVFFLGWSASLADASSPFSAAGFL